MTENRSRFVLLCQQALACAVVVAVAAPAAGVVTLEFVAPPGPAAAGGASATGPAPSMVPTEPVSAVVNKVPLTPPAGSREDRSEGLTLMSSTQPVPEDGDPLVSDPQAVDGYATVGVTWDREDRLEDGDIEVSVRTQDDGAWSDWETLPYDADHGPTPGSPEAAGSRNGTDALVVGEVEDVQVKVDTVDGALPDAMSLDIVDPGETEDVDLEEPAIDTARLASATTGSTGTEPTDPAEPTDPVDPTQPTEPVEPVEPTDPEAELVGTPADVTPKPKIFSRAQWGADERMRDKSSLRYFEVHAGFVHHTVNANGYSKEQVPSIIRGIYAYHTQSRGWSDVGYNFLVDRFGRIWEGRAGGVDRPVVGAHTLGYNDHAFAMSAIGNFETVQPGDAMLRAYGRLFAWKLSLHGVSAGSKREWVYNKWMPAINGHRDVGQTACPGKNLYAKIGTIRSLAASGQRPFASRNRDTDVTGSRWPDLVVRDKESQKAFVVKTGGQVGFAGPRRAASGFGDADLVVASADLSGDGRSDVLARDKATKETALHLGDGAGHFGAATKRFRQFRNLDQLAAVGDLDGDGHADVVGRRPDGVLKLFPGRGDSGFGKSKVLAEGWAYGATSGAADFDGDGNVDLLVRKSDKVLLVPGTGRAALGAPVALPRTWAGYDVVTGMGDVTNDGHPDVVARVRKSQQTFVYPGDGKGGIGTRLGPFPTFKGVDFLATAAKASSRWVDLVGRNANGRLVLFANRGGTNIDGVVEAGVQFRNTNLVLNVGDWNGDGHGDVITRGASTGDLLLRAGDGRGGFAAPVVAGRGWGQVALVAAVGDITGDGYPDLMGQPKGAAMRIYPGNGRAGFKNSFVARSAITATDQLGVGLWNGDGSPDSLVRRSDGGLVLHAGNGPGGLTGSKQVGSKAGGYDWMLGAGDVDGDGFPDVLARAASSGRLWLLPGNGNGFGTRRFVADGFGRYDLGG